MVNEWAEGQQKIGDPKGGRGGWGRETEPFHSKRRGRLIETVPGLQRDRNGTEDVLKVVA